MPTGLFDDLIETEEPKQSTAGLFDDLVDRDEGTTHTGKYFPPEERKGVTYEGNYYPSIYELEKEKATSIRKAAPKGIFGRFQEGATKGFGGSAAQGVTALTQSDDQLKSILLQEQEKLQASEGEPTLTEKAAEIAGNLLGAGLMAGLGQAARGGKAALGAQFGLASAGDSFLKSGLRALAEGKSPDEAVKIARKVAIAGAVIGAVEGTVVPTGGLASVGQAARAAGAGGAIFGGGAVVRNVAEQAAGLKTPILEGVPQAGLFGAAFPVALGGAGAAARVLLRKGTRTPAPAPAPEPPPTTSVEVLPPEQTGLTRQPASGRGPVIDIETIVNPSKPLEPSSLKMIEDGIGKAISENKPQGEAPGLIAGTALEKWADDVMSAEFRGRLSINPVDLLAKEIPALAIKGAAVIERGVRDYPAWSAEMTKLYGDEFKPILRKVYMQSLQVKGTQPNVLRSSEAPVQPVHGEPEQSTGQVPTQEGSREVGQGSQQPLQPGTGVSAQVPLIERPVQEVAANYENLLGEIQSYGVENFNRALGAKAKTPEDIAALKAMAESHSARISQLKKDGNFPEAMRLSGFQPMEAYKFATEKPASRGIAASARDALASDVPHGTEAGFVRLPEEFRRVVEEFNVNDPVAPPVSIDTQNVVPRLQPWNADKLISSSPEGVGRIPGLGRLFDPRAGAFEQVDRAIITNAKERGVGETVAALWGETNKGSNPFKADADGNIALARGTGRLSDVIEAEMRTPGSQPLTPEQRTWINEVWKPVHKDVTEMLEQEGVKGFDVSEGERGGGGAYFPRIAIGKKDTSSGKSKPSGGSVGGKQFFQKQRQYDSEAEGSGTTIYEPDAVKRVASYISRAYRAIADHRLSQDESLGGRALSDGPPLFQKEGLVMQPAFSGKVFPKETADRLNSFYGQSSHDWVRKLGQLNDAAKAFKLTLDLSAPLTQGLPVLFNRPGVWGRSTWNSFRAMMDPNHLGAVLNRPEMKEAASELAQLGVSLGRLQDFMAGAEKGQLITKIPVLGKAVEATGRSFGAFMDLAKIEMWRSFREIVPREKWPAMAELVENLAGTSRMESIGISPSRALGERLLLLAPSYYRAGVSLVATAAQGGAAGNAARMALARFGMGVTLVSVAGMAAAGLGWEEIKERLNPSRGKFLKVPVQVGDKKVEVGFGHLLISLARLAGDTIEEAQSDKPAGSGVEREPWKKWLRNHSAPVPSTLTDLVTGTDAMGNDVSTTKAITSQFVPISADQALQEGTIGQRAFDASMSFFGMNAYPQSVQEQFRNERDKMSQSKFGKEYESLPLGKQATIHKALKADPGFKTPPAGSKTRERAFENDVARQTRLLKSLSPEIQKHIEELGLHVTGYEPRIKVGGVDLPLTRKQAEAYGGLIAEEYAKVLKTAKWTNLANLKPEVRQDRLNELLLAGKNRAKTKFMNQKAGK